MDLTVRNTIETCHTSLNWDLKDPLIAYFKQNLHPRYEHYWAEKTTQQLPSTLFDHARIWLEIGAGSGDFFVTLAGKYPEISFVPIERCRERCRTLLKRSERAGYANLLPVRGNAIPLLLKSIPTASIERLFILYPCPYPKNSQKKHRWYLHPAMPHLVRVLKPGGVLVWTSDQKFYIDEAHKISSQVFALKTLYWGSLAPNPYNGLEHFPNGRTKFEQTFLAQGFPAYELVVSKNPA